MDVPYVSSGARSRAHYALVRKVESAVADNNPQLAERYTLDGIESVRRELARPGLSSKKYASLLIQLLYCESSLSFEHHEEGKFEFALPHAVNLAEAGTSVHEKRIGYLFCAELMPPRHELRLMLVNTLRKDLESPSIARICLALDSLIAATTEDVIPAVQTRLHDLLSHNSLHVRRRAIHSFRALARHNDDLLGGIKYDIKKRLKDPYTPVVIAALSLSSVMVTQLSPRQDYQDLLEMAWSSATLYNSLQRPLLIKLLQTMRLTKEFLPEIGSQLLEIIGYAYHHRDEVMLYESFLLLSTLPPDFLTTLQASSDHPFTHYIRHWLTVASSATPPNDQYVFISCLERLDPSLWAGVSPVSPIALEESDVERVMMLLESLDGAIRRKTLKTLYRVEPEIVNTYYTRAVQNIPPALTVKGKDEYVARLLEVIDVVCGEDGESYARQLKSLLEVAEDGKAVLEGLVESVLSRIRQASELFRVACAASLLASLIEPTVIICPTYMVILAALACEFSTQSSISPVAILNGMADRLTTYPAHVQDVALLCMLRVAAGIHNTVPKAVVEKVAELRQNSTRRVGRRCDQFLTLTVQRDVLSSIVSRARSSSLPDFVYALELHQPTSIPPSPASKHSDRPTLSRTSSPTSPRGIVSKLRYAAYDAPQPIGSLRRGLSSGRSVSGSSHSDPASVGGSDRAPSRGSSVELLSRTITAGDLTLVAARQDLETKVQELQTKEDTNQRAEDLASRVDLIAFDTSPPAFDQLLGSPLEAEPDFKNAWDALEKFDFRGWSQLSPDLAVERLRERMGGDESRLRTMHADQEPFKGELKVFLFERQPGNGVAGALRLRRESEDESCLWRMRCADEGLRAMIKAILTE